ncbi:HNH endonuclease signature motif containing protein [Anabaena cylindrica UHCC 0172]|uniref:HNH endonuclease n=1 Tax=Anabaena cylindrica TaxID=1165 RepID=UPI002B1FC051|nr:HNH endonuclease signature motif containing protein [Anabaena cylindrica]MEA5551416.1 HNH endonuclease signature motif containing protein [Anabaena cylindrica UHCC 0172]
MSSRKITDSIQQQVRQRALELCEYCHASERWQYVLFTVDHVIPLSKNGKNTIDNLALACFHCNRRKSNKITGINPESGNQVELFNPRKSLWNDHFIWTADGLIIIGLTPIGKATIATLDLNRERIINIRAADKAINRHPPPEDPMSS